MKVSFILLRLFHDKDCKVTSFLAGSSRPLLICCLWKDLQRATMSSPNSWIRGETPRAARADLRGTPVADVDPRKTHLTRTSLRNERKRALTRVTPSGATSCSEIRKGGGTCLTVHLRDSWPRYRCTVMCRPPPPPTSVGWQLVEVHSVATRSLWVAAVPKLSKWLWQLPWDPHPPAPPTSTPLPCSPHQRLRHF